MEESRSPTPRASNLSANAFDALRRLAEYDRHHPESRPAQFSYQVIGGPPRVESPENETLIEVASNELDELYEQGFLRRDKESSSADMFGVTLEGHKYLSEAALRSWRPTHSEAVLAATAFVLAATWLATGFGVEARVAIGLVASVAASFGARSIALLWRRKVNAGIALAIVSIAVGILSVLLGSQRPEPSTGSIASASATPTSAGFSIPSPDVAESDLPGSAPSELPRSSDSLVSIAPNVGRAIQLTPAAGITVGLPYSGANGSGAVEVGVASPLGSTSGVYVELHQSKVDAVGEPVPGDIVSGGTTDNTGEVTLEAPSGEYVVLVRLNGYPWGDLEPADGLSGISIQSGQLTKLVITMGSITVATTNVDGVLTGRYVEFHLQKTDAQGSPVAGDIVGGGSTDNTGTFSATLTPGRYAVAANFDGYNWGDLADRQGRANVLVAPGRDTRVDVRLGRIRVRASAGTYVEVHLQVASSNGSPAMGAIVAGGSVDNTGYLSMDLTAGTYAVKYAERARFDVLVIAAKTRDVG